MSQAKGFQEEKENFHDFLSSLAKGNIHDAPIHTMLEKLGYDEDRIYSNVSIEDDDVHPDDLMPDSPVLCSPPDGYDPEPGVVFNFDVVAARTVRSTPYVTIDWSIDEIKQDNIEYITSLQNLHLRHKISNTHYTVLISQSGCLVIEPSKEKSAFLFSELEYKDVERLYELLKAPDQYPQGPVYPAAYHPNQTTLQRFQLGDNYNVDYFPPKIDTQDCSLNLHEFSDLLYTAENAKTANEKGNILEDIAAKLFESISYVEVRDRNVVTKIGEIDLVVENSGEPGKSLFDYQSRFILIECKNWNKPVPAEQIGYFKTKCEQVKVDLGIVFAWNGVTGEGDGQYADRLMSKSDPSDINVISINSRDLYRILEGRSFYEIIDEKLYQRQFDL